MKKEYLEQLKRRNQGVSIYLMAMFQKFLSVDLENLWELKCPIGFSYSGDDKVGYLNCPDGSQIRVIRMSQPTK